MTSVPTSFLNRRRLLRGLAATAGAALTGLAFARSGARFPTGRITLVTPMAAGGSTDYAARLLARDLTQALGVPAVVDNKAGASGAIGAVFVARAEADGHTLLVAPSTVAVVNPLISDVSYDMNNDFRPIGLLAKVENVLVASKRSGIQSIEDVIRLAKAQPGKLTFGSNGEGSALHLAGEFLAQLAGVDLLHVPYRGASPAELALIAGEIDLLVTNTVSVAPHIKAGSIVPVAVLSSAPSQQFPDLPTGSQTLPGFVVDTWVAIYAPKDTSDAVVTKLNGMLNEFLTNPEYAKDMISRGFEPAPGTPQEALQFQQAEAIKWTKVVSSVKAAKRLK